MLDRAVESGAPPLLCGKVSRDIKQEVEKLTGNPQGKKLRWFSECFSVSILQTEGCCQYSCLSLLKSVSKTEMSFSSTIFFLAFLKGAQKICRNQFSLLTVLHIKMSVTDLFVSCEHQFFTK